jgi:membrane-bound ClpP family serine protease
MARSARLFVLAALIATGIAAQVLPAAAQDSTGTAYSIELSSSINPATAKWVSSAR